MKKEKIIIIAGPTGVGKTSTSIDLALKLNGEIISADSMQIYKGMDIGTAKIKEEEMNGVPHHMLDIADPFDNFTVADYSKMARQKISDIRERGKIPIIVGGTGLYINSLLYKMDFNQAQADEDYRAKLWNFYEENGEDALFQLLQEQAGNQTVNVDKQNIKRVIRALEIIKSKGEFKSFDQAPEESEFDCELYILSRDREVLYDNINKRVEVMFEEGLVDEVKKLQSMGLNSSHQSMKGIGYRQVLDYLENACSLEEAKEKIKQESRRYAKRQITWFKRYKDSIWVEMP